MLKPAKSIKPTKSTKLAKVPDRPELTLTITLTLRELLALADALAIVFQSSPPGLVAYRISVLYKRLNPELDGATAQRSALYKKYWPKDTTGLCAQNLTDPSTPKFTAEFDELCADTVTYHLSPKDLIPLSFLEYVKSITPFHVTALMPLLKTEDAAS